MANTTTRRGFIRPRIRPVCLIPLLQVLSILVSLQAEAQGQAQALNWSADDSSRVVLLRSNGQSVTGRHAVLWAPKDSISNDSLRKVLAGIDTNLEMVKRLIHAPLPWQRLANRPVVFYFAPDRFISHASGQGDVFISFWRVGANKAPFIHEALHEILAPQPPFSPWEFPDSAQQLQRAESSPLWLLEGLPDYLAQVAASRTGVPEGDIFEAGGPATIDSVCAARVRANPAVAAAIQAVGRSGRPPQLFTTERSTVAPVFYPCSHSFTKHLADKIGIAGVVALFPAIREGDWQAALTARAGPLGELRGEWARRLGIP